MDLKPAAAILGLVSLCAAVLLPSCGPPKAPPISQISPVEATRSVLQTRVGPTGTTGPIYCRNIPLCGSEILPDFYRARDFRPAWIFDGLALTEASSYLGALRLVSEDGLNPDNYHLEAIESLLSEITEDLGKKPRKARPEALVDLELLLTDSFLLCGSQLVHGQVDPETFQSEWFIKGRIEDLAAVLEKGLADQDLPGALDSLRPNHAVYRGLIKAFRATRTAAAAGGWPEFPPGPKLERSAEGPRVEALRAGLEARGDIALSESVGRDFFDGGLEEGVKSFQRRHGLQPDGIVGPATEAALNVPAEVRLTQILANLERWRWITQDLGEKYILINVADFRVGVFEGAREVLSMPAIVGSAYRRTPEFSGKMTYIEINPTWTVPPKLVREDILPKARKDPGYLKERGIRVFRGWSEEAPEIDAEAVDWSQVEAEAEAFKFRQDPGPRNSLGRIKFMFPNKFDVYLHDTPDRGLFARAERDLSSGCIRLEQPLELAEYILRGDPVWSREKILAALADTTTRVISLRNPIGVHLLYWTAWLTDDERVQFRGDIYRRDEALSEALRQHALPTAGTPVLPSPDAADIDVDEVRLGIDPHATGPQGNRSPIELLKPEARDPDVDGLPEKVQAVLGDARPVGPQVGIGPGRPVAGDDMEGPVGARLPGEHMKQVEETDIDVLGLSGPMVSEDVIDLLERRGDEAAGMAIVEGRLLPGMGVVQGEAAVGGKRLGEGGGRDP